jgi:hypothetical protein
MATVLLKRNPDTRRSMAAWFSRRNLRFNLAGQQFEATIAETQGSIDIATSADSELAEVVARTPETEGEQRVPESELTDQEVENARRQAVAEVAQNAVRLGWQWAQGEHGAATPVVDVTWNEDGRPNLRVLAAARTEEARRVLRLLLDDAEWKRLQDRSHSNVVKRSQEPSSGQFRIRPVWKRRPDGGNDNSSSG